MSEDGSDSVRIEESSEEEIEEEEDDEEEDEEEEYHENGEMKPKEYVYTADMLVQMKRSLTVRGRYYLSLAKVEEGSSKKMRFGIVVLCPVCKAANHVRHTDLEPAPPKKCNHCKNSKIFVTKTEVFTIYAPIGTRQGSTTKLENKGSFGPQGIRGDIVIKFLDEPHEHFLRVFDDIIVYFQIDHEESVNGVVRLLTLLVPNSHEIVLKTKEDEPINHDDVLYVNGLGLPNCYNPQKRGRLILVFIVKDQRSMFPVKLKNIKIQDGLLPKFPPPPIKRKKKVADSTSSKKNGLKRKKPTRRRSPDKRRKLSAMKSRSNTSSKSFSAIRRSPGNKDGTTSSHFDPPSVDVDTEEERVRCSRILSDFDGRLTVSEIENQGLLNPVYLTFLDRLVYIRAIPMPWKLRVRDAIPMSNLALLWKRRSDPYWWHRVRLADAYQINPEAFIKEMHPSRNLLNVDDIITLPKPSVFDVRDVNLDEEAEALKTTSTILSSCSTEYPQFTPEKFKNHEKIKLLHQMREYIKVTIDRA